MLRNIVAAVLLLGAAAHAKTPRPLATVPISQPNGKKIAVSKYRGKVVLIALISSTCKGCIQSIGYLNSLQNEFGAKGLQVLAAVADEKAQYSVLPFITQYRPMFPVGYVTKDEMIKIADIPQGMRPFVPVFLFVDPKGVVRYQFYGDDQFFKNPAQGSRGLVTVLLRAVGQPAVPKQ